jgi:3',5'-cyclic-AMP phosphodiesterase
MIQKKNAITILHFTDSHLFASQEHKFLHVCPYTHLRAAMADASKRQSVPADLLLLTGDISQDFSVESYELAFNAINDPNLAANIGVILGNHDDPDLLQRSIGKLGLTSALQKHFTFGAWHIVLLNSYWRGHTAGLLDASELEFLQQELDGNRNKNIIIFLHHHVLPVGAAWLDKIGLHNAAQFLKIVSAHSNIKAVIAGHVHQEYASREHNIDFLTTPSLAWQFTEHTATFALNDKMPGFRVLQLFADGNYTTEVVRLAFNVNFVPNLKSAGY